MTNERKTENIVRNHLNKFSDKCLIEEQSSSNPKIDKLLKTASKKGSGKGYPEFIISYHANQEFIIVIECKGDIKCHESNNHDKYAEYAVDGVLLYASYLSKDFDVLAIAVSGQNSRELKVSHYLYLKGTSKPATIFGDKLLPLDNYLDGYIHSPEKFRQDYDSLLAFSRELNQKLHSNKIAEKDRGLLISSILIALENTAFSKSYKDYDKPEQLAHYLVNTVSNELKGAHIQPERLENLEIQFSFIKTNTTLSGEEHILSKLIDDIDSNINTFIKTYEYYDVLGHLYIEFLRYANSDKSLGIVLTPAHITELFCDLAVVNQNSVVYDNCAGTGGFLISAMRKMIKDANEDSAKIKHIKEFQIVGVEYQAYIFALACSNMFIHQDGKNNIIQGSCFNEATIKEVREYHPNVGFLNPPYKTEKTDPHELEFMLNNLETLSAGGTCIAIVPMERVLATSGKKFELKKQLLAKHTLEAVMSMPDQLFINSGTGTVTAIVVVTAHKPHPKNKETYFGYWKNDGFVIRKNRGRIDAYGLWANIKAEWLDSFINRRNKIGLSVNKIVTPKDEWCAEAYMETDYSQLKEKDFVRDLKKFVLFKKMEIE